MAKKLKILLVIEKPHIFYYKKIIRSLCERGHKVTMLFAKHIDDFAIEPINKLKREVGGFDYDQAFYRTKHKRVAELARLLFNYRTFSDSTITSDMGSVGAPIYNGNRLWGLLPLWLKVIARLPDFSKKRNNIMKFLGFKWVGKSLKYITENLPVDRRILTQVEELKPDVVIGASGNIAGSSMDFDYIQAAGVLGVPTIFSINSWDYLYIKSLIHCSPDALFCWNEHHADTAVSLHRIPREKIRITGTPHFDDWFSISAPSTSREEFCRKFGLNPEHPYLVYFGSSNNFGDESWLIKPLRQALDNSSDPRIRQVQIVIRPHPAKSRFFKPLQSHNIAIVPEVGSTPNNLEDLRLFYDTVFHSVAAVGVGTSAFIDAMILGKPAIVQITEAYRYYNNAPHMQTLFSSNAVEMVYSAEEFIPVLRDLLDGKDSRKDARMAFLQKYIRPRGLDKPAAAVYAEELENFVYSTQKQLVSKQKLISIGMPTHNRADVISYAIDCLLSQTYSNLELIISDDFSTDDTQKLCKEYARKDKRVRYLRNENNLGLVGNFGRALKAARGEYFFWAPDDDWWDPKFVETLVDVLEKNPKYDVAMSWWSNHYDYKYDQHKPDVWLQKHDYTSKSYYEVYREMIKPKKKMNPIFVVGMYRREFLNRLFQRYFPWGFGEAWTWMCEVALSTHFYSVPAALTSKYRHPEALYIRHPYVGKFWSYPFMRTYYVFNAFWWLITSPNIPLRRKSLIFVPWVGMLWRYKRKIVFEIFSALTRF